MNHRKTIGLVYTLNHDNLVFLNLLALTLGFLFNTKGTQTNNVEIVKSVYK